MEINNSIDAGEILPKIILMMVGISSWAIENQIKYFKLDRI